MSLKYSAGPQPVSTTIASIAGGTGLTTFTITSASGLATVVAGELAYLRIADGTASAETLSYTISGTTITCSATGFAHVAGDAVAFDILSGGAMTALKDDAISGFPENALSAAGALVKGTGVTNRITLTSAAATFTLADGTYKGEVCRILVDRTSTKLVTIDPAGSTTIDGSTTRIMWAGETALLAWNGTEWEKRAGKSIPMMASIYLAADITSFPDTVLTQITLNTLGFDNSGLVANIASNKVTIQRPGTYIVNPSAGFVLGAAASALIIGDAQKAAVSVVESFSNAAAASYAIVSANKPVVCAAGEDIKLYGYQQSGTTVGVKCLGGVNNTYLSVIEQPAW